MMLPVPEPIQKRNAVSGAMRVICFGRFSMIRAAIATIQSMPPAACMRAAVVTTARMIATAAAGGSPGASPKMKTSTNVPRPPQSPTPTPPARVPMTMAPTTTRASRTKLTLMASPSVRWGAVHDVEHCVSSAEATGAYASRRFACASVIFGPRVSAAS